MKKKTIGIIVGSLRRDSFSRKVAQYLADLLAEEYEVVFVNIDSLAMYNQDLDNDDEAPKEWVDLRQEVKALDAVLFVTPEYNRSVPAVLKNALDIASRPKTDNAWKGKPGAIVSVSPGSIGGFGANHHLRQITACLNIFMMPQPEAYIGGVDAAVDGTGVSDESVRGFLQRFSATFAKWVERF